MARTLISIGLLFILAGAIVAFVGKVPGIGKLPGDLTLKKGNFTFYFPWVTCILISILLSVILNLFRK